MNRNEINTQLLIQYLDGELDDNTAEEVGRKIFNDPVLQLELENLRSAQQVVRAYALRQELKDIHLEMVQALDKPTIKKAPVRSMVNNVFRVAASIIVIVGLISFFQYFNLTSNKLFESSYQSYRPSVARGAQDGSYLEKFYTRNQFKKITDTLPLLFDPSAKDYFYAANACLEEDNVTGAIKYFKLAQAKNRQMGTHMYEDDTEYYLAMSLLKNDKPSEARPLFEKIHSDKKHLYNDKVSSWFLFKLKLVTTK